MSAGVEKSDGELCSELKICRIIKIGHKNQSLKAMKLAKTEFKWWTKRSLWSGRQVRPMWCVKEMNGAKSRYSKNKAKVQSKRRLIRERIITSSEVISDKECGYT